MAAGLSCALGGTLPVGDALAENGFATPGRITAVYRVDVGSFNLGTFTLTTTFRGDGYQMRGEGRFTVLAGLIYEWRGVTASTGRVTSAGPEPAMYAFNYSDSGKKFERLRITFDGRSVSGVSIVPRTRPLPRTIPVTSEQLDGVLDPMSSAFLTAKSSNPNGDLNVCNHTLPVFDGRQRYDLVVTDLEMPELGGFDLISRLRKDERFKATPIVIISSRVNPEHRRRARDLGVRALVAKPITRRKLLEALAAR